MEIQSQTTKKVVGVIIANVLLLFLLYCIPMHGFNFDICVYKIITGRECFNCGMTRAFLCVLHGEFNLAMEYNRNVIVIFPFTVAIYLYSIYKFIFKGEKKNEKYE